MLTMASLPALAGVGGRPDGYVATEVPGYRRFMPALMPTRNGSIVFFDRVVEVAAAERFVAETRAAHPDLHPTLFHVVLWSLGRMFDRHPHLNRFLAGGQLYDRDGIWISFTVKTELSEDGTLVEVKGRPPTFRVAARARRPELPGQRELGDPKSRVSWRRASPGGRRTGRDAATIAAPSERRTATVSTGKVPANSARSASTTYVSGLRSDAVCSQPGRALERQQHAGQQQQREDQRLLHRPEQPLLVLRRPAPARS